MLWVHDKEYYLRTSCVDVCLRLVYYRPYSSRSVVCIVSVVSFYWPQTEWRSDWLTVAHVSRSLVLLPKLIFNDILCLLNFSHTLRVKSPCDEQYNMHVILCVNGWVWLVRTNICAAVEVWLICTIIYLMFCALLCCLSGISIDYLLYAGWLVVFEFLQLVISSISGQLHNLPCVVKN